jgi:hypothetical protein
MTDWPVVHLPSVLSRKVTTLDTSGAESPDDGSWHRNVSETHYVLAAFLNSKGLLVPGVDASRRPELVIMHSQLTDLGQAFEESLAIDRWMTSLDRRKAGAPITADGLERRWKKFRESRPMP